MIVVIEYSGDVDNYDDDNHVIIWVTAHLAYQPWCG